MDLLRRFQQHIIREKLFDRNDTLLLAVSGGLDSVVLCDLCIQSGFPLLLAHANFHLRGEESDRDEHFVRDLAKKYGKVVLVKSFETERYAQDANLSIQVAARNLRYQWFHELLEDPTLAALAQMDSAASVPVSGAKYILTAHHLDDNVETLLMHFFRGTGMGGLRAMAPKQDRLVRPLLFAKKEELKAYAQDEHLPWVEDSSNDLDKYARNYLRRSIIPLMEKIYPGTVANLASNIERFRDIDLIYQEYVSEMKRKLFEPKGNEIHIPVRKLQQMVPLQTICFEICKEFGYSASQTAELIALLDSESGRILSSPSHRIIKHRNWLIVSPHRQAEPQTIVIDPGISQAWISNFSIHLSRPPLDSCSLHVNPAVALLDLHDIRFPLLIRKWKPGDYFYPLGMRKKKKLARFFIDQKLSKLDKEKIWVMESDRKIIWVMGLRIDDRFKVKPQTAQVLKIEMRMS